MALLTPKRPRPRLYYGWVIVIVMAAIGLVQTGVTNPANGIFLKPVTEHFGWSRSLFVGAVSAGTIVGGVAAVAIGPALDRYGPRWIVSVGVLLVGGALISLAFVHNAWQFYLAMIVGRASLQAALNLGAAVVVPKWFIRQRGRAVAFSGLGMRAGNAISPLIAQGIVSGFGWRPAFFGLGVLVLAVALLPAMLFLRRQPEDMGLRPDGDPLEKAAHTGGERPQPSAGGEMNFTMRQAAATPAFWLITISAAFSLIVVAGINLNLVAYLEDQGLSAGNAVAVLTIISLVSMPSSIVAGFLSERIALRPSLAVTYLALALSIFVLLRVDTLLLSVLYGVYFGLFFGLMITLSNLIYPHFFGRQALGAIRGVTTPLQMGAIATGPLVASAGYDVTGEYTLVFVVFLVLLALGGLLILIARRPAAPTVG